MKEKMLNNYDKIYTSIENAIENLNLAKNILYSNVLINSSKYKQNDIDWIEKSLSNTNKQIKNIIIPAIKNMSE